MRFIKADEINVMPKQTKKNARGAYAQVLLYKDARVDMLMLDEEYSPFGWQCSYNEIKGALYCTISVWDSEHNQWVSKSSNGTESNMEATKGEASDAFKRAGFMWGCGRELYSSPQININLNSDEYEDDYRDNTKVKLKPWVKFSVSQISVDKESREISSLTIVDNNGNERFSWSKTGGTKKAKSFAQKPVEPVHTEPPKPIIPVQTEPPKAEPVVEEPLPDINPFLDFLAIVPYTPIEAKNHLFKVIGATRGREILASLGVVTKGELNAMTQETYLKALETAEKIWKSLKGVA